MMVPSTVIHRARRGTVTFEATMAIVVASSVVIGAVQVLSLAVQQRRAESRRAVAMREVGNVMEEIAARPWSELTAEKFATWELSPHTLRDLPEGKLHIEVVKEDEAAAGRRISVQVDWRIAAKQRVAPVRLVAWRFPPQESTP